MQAKRCDGELIDPAAKAWEEAAAERIALAATPLAAQQSRYVRAAWADRPYGLVREVETRAAHNGDELYVRLKWTSPTRVAGDGGDGAATAAASIGGTPHPIDGPDAFPDAAAVMFPANGSASLETMGSDKEPVNVWRWTPGVPDTVEDLIATGLGTARPTGTPNGLRARSLGEGTEWTVVVGRRLKPSDGAGTVSFAQGKATQIAVAVWTGANQERAGIKAASQSWLELELED